MLIDGENLLCRFEEMKREGQNPQSAVRHEPGRFVWISSIARVRTWDLIRISYYTTVVGDDEKQRELECQIASLEYKFRRPSKFHDQGTVVPRVFRKPRREQKTASVDINIAIDMLRHAYTDAMDELFLLTGDGDYVPLMQEAMRQGKVVRAGAFSSGLHPDIATTADDFVNLDHLFF